MNSLGKAYLEDREGEGKTLLKRTERCTLLQWKIKGTGSESSPIAGFDVRVAMLNLQNCLQNISYSRKCVIPINMFVDMANFYCIHCF